MASFSSFTFDIVEERFNIKEVKQLPLLIEWLSASYQSDDKMDFVLNLFREHLLEKVLIWNEDELKMFFIGPIIEFARLSTDNFQPFTQRTLSMTHQGEEIIGRVDFMIASGRRLPKAPYFCIHEYKQEPDKDGDPLGQALIAMVTAQYLNEQKFPLLGAYVVGRSWFFVVLEGNQYAKSKLYDASSEDIFDIFAILQKSKEIMMRFV